jgi:hypothetical protein
VVCRPTQREAEEFTRYVIGHADMAAVGHLAEMHQRDARGHEDDEGAFRRAGEGPVERQVLARGNFCAIGDPDRAGSPSEAAKRRSARPKSAGDALRQDPELRVRETLKPNVGILKIHKPYTY